MNKLKIKGLTHKICYTDTLFEMYQVNVEPMDYFTKENYSSCGNDISDHYDWLIKTYNNFSVQDKDAFKYIFSQGVHAYHFLNTGAGLPDDASVEDVLNAFKESETEEVKTAGEKLENISDTYTKHYLEYYKKREHEFEKRATEIIESAEEKKFDILTFMEEKSGIKFSDFAELANFKFPETVAFYFTFRPIGAMGFQTADEIISTVQGNIDNLTSIVSPPFHEFSHFLFRTFTLFDDFKELAEKLKAHKALFERWEKNGKQNYDWLGWVEENLVEGFSKFLNNKFRDMYCIEQNQNPGIYIFDKEFTDHLISIDFDPTKVTLKEVSMEYLKVLL